MTSPSVGGRSTYSTPQHCLPFSKQPEGDRIRTKAERGSLSAESAILLPVVFMLIFLIVQIGFWASARNAAIYSAREGATAEATYQSGQSATAVTQTALTENTHGTLHDTTVMSSRTPDAVTVTVRGSAMTLVPLYDLPPIEQTVSIPIEQYVP